MIYDPDKECEIMVNRMKEFCEMRGITQYRLAKDMNMSTSGMSSIFRRKVVPSIYTLMQICNGLEVRLQDLFLEGNDEESEADMFPLDKASCQRSVFQHFSERAAVVVPFSLPASTGSGKGSGVYDGTFPETLEGGDGSGRRKNGMKSIFN